MAQLPSEPGCAVFLARLRHLQDHHLALLDQRETERRSRFTTRDDRDRFTLAAVLLRIVAGQATGVAAAAVAVSRRCDRCGRQHGRPQLPGTTLQVSISHSGDLVVVALTAAGPVGVDVELIHPRSFRGLLPSVCTTSERSLVHTADDFYTYWTRKEAVLKAMGDGFDREMTDVAVAPPRCPPSLHSILGRPTPSCSMSAVQLEGYAGAVAVLAPVAVKFDVVDAGVAVFGP